MQLHQINDCKRLLADFIDEVADDKASEIDGDAIQDTSGTRIRELVTQLAQTAGLIVLCFLLTACPRNQPGTKPPSQSNLTEWSRYVIAATSGFLSKAQQNHSTECVALSGVSQDSLITRLQMDTAILLNDASADKAAVQSRIASTQATLKTKRLCNAINTAGFTLNLAIDARNIYCSGTPPFGQARWGEPGGTCQPDGTAAPKLQAVLAELDRIVIDAKSLAGGN